MKLTPFAHGLAIATSVSSGVADAATLSVTSLADNGPGNCAAGCTLRDAIDNSAPGDTIFVDVSGTIVLNAASPIDIDHDLSIVGRGTAQTLISGNDATRIFNANTGTIQIRDIALVNGRSVGDSGVTNTPGLEFGEGGALWVGSPRKSCCSTSISRTTGQSAGVIRLIQAFATAPLVIRTLALVVADPDCDLGGRPPNPIGQGRRSAQRQRAGRRSARRRG